MSQELEEKEFFTFYKLSSIEKKEIVEKLRKTIMEREEVLLAVIFGSFLSNSTFRDIDLALYVRGVDDYLKYKFRLDSVLTDTIGYPVDTTILNNAPSWFILEVCSEGQLLYSRLEGLFEIICKKGLGEQYDLSIKLKLLS